MEKETIGDRIEKIRLEKRFSWKEFSDKIHIPLKNLQNYSSGKSENIPHTVLLAFYKKLMINANWLLTGDGEMHFYNDRIDLNTHEMSDILRNTINLAEKSNEIEDFKSHMRDLFEKYSITAILLPKLKSLKGVDFFGKLLESFTGRGERMTLLFIEFLDRQEIISLSSSSQDSAKQDLLTILNNFTINRTKKAANFSLLWESDKINLENWIEKNLDNLDCYVILLNADAIRVELKNELNFLNKKLHQF